MVMLENKIVVKKYRKYIEGWQNGDTIDKTWLEMEGRGTQVHESLDERRQEYVRNKDYEEILGELHADIGVPHFHYIGRRGYI